MTLNLRYMTMRDIGQVVEIDRAAFSTPWSARSYAYEVGESAHSHMVVLERSIEQPNGGLRKLVQQMLGRANGSHPAQRIIAYGGLWRIMDEAHISTIASHPDVRGSGYGELMLASMIRRSIVLGAAYIVLEVRVSNTVAQNLYTKYGFRTVDTKRGYYHDNNEDAYDMRLNLTNYAMVERFEAQFRVLKQRMGFHDAYTETPRPPVA